MSVDRMTRVNELLRREIGEALPRVMHENGFDMSAVTLTHVVADRNLRTARVFVSIREHLEDRDWMFNQIRHHRAEIQAQINRDLKLKYTPVLNFEMDLSLEKGDRVLHLLSELTPATDTDSEPEEEPTPGKEDPDHHE